MARTTPRLHFFSLQHTPRGRIPTRRYRGCHRMIIVLTRDQASKERGADNAMKFKELLAAARVRVKNREGMPHEASCVHICENYLGPYEEARASLYKKSKSKLPAPKEAERPRVNHIQFSTPTAATPSSDGSDLTHMVAAIQQQMNNIQSMMQSPQAPPQTPLPAPSYGGKPAYSGGKKDYSRSPPPTTYESQSASSPYPSAAPTPSRSVYILVRPVVRVLIPRMVKGYLLTQAPLSGTRNCGRGLVLDSTLSQGMPPIR